MIDGLAATCYTDADTRAKVEHAIANEVSINMAGTLQGVIWGGKYSGVDQSARGVAVTIKQYGMSSYGFFIREDRVRFNGKWLRYKA